MKFSFTDKLLFFLVAVSISLSALPGQDSVIVVGGDRAYPPYEFIENGVPTGFNVELLQEVAKLKKLDIEIKLGTWSEVREKLNSGNIDMVTGMFFSEERAKQVDFSIMHSSMSYNLFYHKDKLPFELSDSENKLICIEDGTLIHDEIKEKYPNITFELHPTMPEVLQRIEEGACDGAIIAGYPGLYSINKMGLLNVKRAEISFPHRKQCFAVKKGNEYLLGILNEGIAELMATGRYHEIYEKWLGKYQEKSLWAEYSYVIYALVVLVLLFPISLVWSWSLNNKVKEKTSELRQVLDLVPYIIYAKDKNGNFILGNKALAEAYGTHVKKIKDIDADTMPPKQKWLEEILEEDSQILNGNLDKLIQKHTYSDDKGNDTILKSYKVPFKRISDNEQAVLGIAVNITDSELAKRSLKKSEEKFRQLVSQASVIMIVHDLNGKIIDANKAAINTLGYSYNEFIDLNINDIEVGLEIQSKKQMWQNITQGKVYTIESKFLKKNGKTIPVEERLGVIEIDEETLILSLARDIEQRKKWEEQIKLQSAALAAAVEAIVIADNLGDIVWVNKAFTNLTGYDYSEVIGQNVRLLKSGKQDGDFYKNLWKTITGGDVWKGVMRNKRKDGILYYEESTITPVKDNYGNITNFISIKNDITERMEAERMLNDQMQRYKYLFRHAPIGIFQYDNTLILREFNENFIEIFRSTRQLLMNLDLVNLKDQAFVPHMKSSLDGNTAHYIGPYHTTTSDYDIYISFHVTPYYSEDGEILGGIGIVEDITEMKKIQDELKQSEKKYRSIFNNLVDVYYRADMEGKLRIVSPSISSILGDVEPEEFIGKDIAKTFYMDPAQRSGLLELLDKKGKVSNYEIKMVNSEGEIIYTETSSHYVYDNSGNPIAVEGMIRNISERKEAEAALRYSEHKLRNLVEFSSDGIVLTDEEGRVNEWNPGMEHITLRSRESVEGRYIWDVQFEMTPLALKSQEYFDRVRAITSKVLKEGRDQNSHGYFESEMFRADGETRTIQSSISTIKTVKGYMVVSIIRDISDIKEVEKQLFVAKEKAEESDRLKSEFLAQMSHEIRTPINAILSFSGLIKDEMYDQISDDLQMGFNVIKRAGRRIIRTIDLILNMSAVQTGTYEFNPSNVNLYMDSLQKVYDEFYKYAKDKDIELFLINNASDCTVRGDEYTINQIFNNLVDNAVKYTSKGKVEILIDELHEGIKVSVADTGIGISEEFIPQLFSVFSQEEQGYTRRFEGNGLGLALVKKYCELNNAEISVTSTKNAGSTFSVLFKRN